MKTGINAWLHWKGHWCYNLQSGLALPPLKDTIAILSDAKARCVHIETLMMDEATLERHRQRRVTEAVPARHKCA